MYFMTAHFSVDDTIWVFEDLKKQAAKSIFEQHVLSFFYKLHKKYGITVSFYCFEEFSGIHLSEMLSQYKAEFEENSAWLRFGFHAANDYVRYDQMPPQQAGEDYARIIKELYRIVGEQSIDHIPRIHCWSGNRMALYMIQKSGLKGVLCAEKLMRSGYDLNALENLCLQLTGFYQDARTQLLFLKTHMRVENTPNPVEDILRCRKKHIEIFTHEWALSDMEKEKIRALCKSLSNRKVQWLFSADHEESIWIK